MSELVKRLRNVSTRDGGMMVHGTTNKTLRFEAADELTRLEAIVAKLPVTADGVAAQQDQTYWARHIWPGGDISCLPTQVFFSCCGAGPDTNNSTIGRCNWSKLYSTKAAAESARTQGASDG